MPLLIDGYNLLHASGVLPRGRGPATLERARQALLQFLLNSLTEKELAGATVVFDAAGAPPGLPSELRHGPIQVLFARGKAEADDLIEELIAADHAPRKLLVVSSDHRLQRAARRRRARSTDADAWYHAVAGRRAARNLAPPTRAEKPMPPQTPGETAAWLELFGLQDAEELIEESLADAPPEDSVETPDQGQESTASTSADDAPTKSRKRRRPPRDPKQQARKLFGRGVFPDDYFDDLPDDPLAGP